MGPPAISLTTIPLLLLISPTYIVESDAVKTLYDLLLGLLNSHGGLNSMLFSGAT